MKKLSFLALLMGMTMSTAAQSKYDVKNMQREELDRGVVAVRTSDKEVLISWRYLETDAEDVEFDILCNGKKIGHTTAKEPTTFTTTATPKKKATYTVVPSNTTTTTTTKKVAEAKDSFTLPADAPVGYLNIPIERPADEVDILGDKVTYSANDASMADVDGDGKMEIILKWDPSNSKDNSQSGVTNNTYIDCYRLSPSATGRLWRINMGRNIRSGAHYTQMMVYDLDGDGKAEIVMKTADGTIDGVGNIIGDPEADHREGMQERDSLYFRPNGNWPERYHKDKKGRRGGFIARGPEYLTVFEGATGKALYTTDYVPQRGEMKSWGDNYANRSERYLATIAFLDGHKPSVVMCRGYYARTTLTAWDWDGKQLNQRWAFDSSVPGLKSWGGQGYHNLRVADIDHDGKDEIIYGSMALDHDGTALYNTKWGHGDAMHVAPMLPLSEHFYFFGGHEDQSLTEFRDAETGQTLWTIPARDDVGRALAADIDPENPGWEMWSSHSRGIYNYKGECLDNVTPISINFSIWWDGNLTRNLLDKEAVTRYNKKEHRMDSLIKLEGVKFNNGTKSNPALCCDILGDWREEILCRDLESNNLRLYVSTMPTKYRFHTFLQDHVYRMTVAHQNTCYNQPTCPGFYIGAELEGSGRKFRGWQF